MILQTVLSAFIGLAVLTNALAEENPKGPDNGLSLRVVVDNKEAGIGTIPYDKYFRVYIKNSTNQEIRLWSSIYLRGQTMMSFPIRDSSGQCSVMRRSDTDPDDWEGCPLDTFSIPPRETFTTWQVRPSATIYGDWRWAGVPEPDTGKNVTIRAVLEIKPSDAARQAGVWTGRVESPPITVRFISPELDSPHEYLEERCSKRAIDMMKADPRWVRKRDDYQRTPLHIAARYGLPDVVQWLLANGADINATAYNRFTPLHVAENVEIMNLLIKHGANLEAVAAGGTPLQHHAVNHHRERQHLAKQLLESGAYYDILSATYMGDADRVRTLLDADPAKAEDKNLMREAARRGHDAIVKLLLRHGADPDDADFGGLPVAYFAVEHPAVVKLLIDAGADVTAHYTYVGNGLGPVDSTLLHDAAEKGNVETARLLLDEGIKVNAQDGQRWTPLDIAARRGHVEMVRFLLQAGKGELTLPRDGEGPMSGAASQIRPGKALENKRFAEVVHALHDHGVPIDLYTAISLGDIKRAVALLEADPTLANRKDARGYPTLIRAVDLDRKEIVTALLKHGCDVNTRNDYRLQGTLGGTALHAAAFWGRTDIARILLDHGADANAMAKDGFTPLHEAARCRNLGVARRLLAAGANVNATDNDSRTPLYWAAKRAGGEAMIDLLRQHGARQGKIYP